MIRLRRLMVRKVDRNMIPAEIIKHLEIIKFYIESHHDHWRSLNNKSVKTRTGFQVEKSFFRSNIIGAMNVIVEVV